MQNENELTPVGEVAESLTPVGKPIEVRPSPVLPLLGVLFRQLGLIGGGITTLFTLFSARDIRGIFDYIRGDEFFIVVTVIFGITCTLWGWIRELKGWKKLVTMAELLPDEIAKVIPGWRSRG